MIKVSDGREEWEKKAAGDEHSIPQPAQALLTEKRIRERISLLFDNYTPRASLLGSPDASLRGSMLKPLLDNTQANFFISQ